VLVVDDSPAFRRAAGRLLAAAGFRVVAEAGDAHEALEQARLRRPALVLLDVLLPDRSGLDIAAELASRTGGAVVLTSSRTADEFGGRLISQRFVTKSDLTVAWLVALAAESPALQEDAP
jgi:DNA-binding NarL/FixJ family response regulator